MNFNYIKLFEEYNESISENDVVFSLTHEDIEDLLLPITDKGFKIEITNKFVDSSNDYQVIPSYGINYKKFFISNLIENNIRGAYYINILKEDKKNEDGTWMQDHSILKYSSEDIIEFKFILDEVSQLSKRVEHLEWSTLNTNDSRIWISIFAVCPIIDKKSTKKEFLKNTYKEEFNDCIYTGISRVRDKVINQWTKTFRSANITRHHDNGNKFYFYFKSVSKAVLNLNLSKLESIIGWQGIENIEIKKEEEVKKDNPNIEIPDKTSFIIVVDFKYDEIVSNCKITTKSFFPQKN